jgi:outer membrane protein OmpA-like peptidoglycan-associated protein
LREEDAWWLRERAVAPPPAEAPPEAEAEVEAPPVVEPVPAPIPPVARLAEPSLAGPADVAVVAAATTSPSAPAEQTSSAGRRRGWILAGVLVLALVALAAVLLSQQGGDSSKVATKGAARGTVTTAAPATTAAASSSNGESVTVNTDVLFDVGSSELTASASSQLGNVLSLAQTDTSRHLLIEGFTDSDGDAGLNQQLSEARARAVAQWLIDQGIDAARISVVGHGADNPVAPNDTPENKALNRRVVVALQK